MLKLLLSTWSGVLIQEDNIKLDDGSGRLEFYLSKNVKTVILWGGR
jgi:hypothetical protein